MDRDWEGALDHNHHHRSNQKQQQQGYEGRERLPHSQVHVHEESRQQQGYESMPGCTPGGSPRSFPDQQGQGASLQAAAPAMLASITSLLGRLKGQVDLEGIRGNAPAAAAAAAGGDLPVTELRAGVSNDGLRQLQLLRAMLLPDRIAE